MKKIGFVVSVFMISSNKYWSKMYFWQNVFAYNYQKSSWLATYFKK